MPADHADRATGPRRAPARVIPLVVVLTAALLALSGCPRSTGTPAPPGDASDASHALAEAPVGDASTEALAPAPKDAAPPSPDDGVAHAFGEAKILGAHPIGHTSVVLKVKLEGGLVAAWKPDSRRGKDRYRGEVAARRLARALALENVPPCTLRAFSRADLLRVADSETIEIITKEALADPQGNVPGALVPWIAGLTFPPLEAEPARTRWQRVLAGEASTGLEGASYFADLSTLVAFDTMSGNWDRWSGGNVGRAPTDHPDKKDGPLLFVDNDAAFLAHPPPEALARNTKLLGKTKRFSRSFVAKLRAFEPASLEAVFGEDLAGKPLLPAAAVAGVRARIAEVERAIDAAGPEGAAAFP